MWDAKSGLLLRFGQARVGVTRILIAIGVLRQKEAGAAGVKLNHAQKLKHVGHQVKLWFLDDILLPARWPGRFNQMEFTIATSQHNLAIREKYDDLKIPAPAVAY